MIKEIMKYAEGKMSEEEAMEFWVHLIQHPEDLALLKTYMMYREWYRRKRKKEKGSQGSPKDAEKGYDRRGSQISMDETRTKNNPSGDSPGPVA